MVGALVEARQGYMHSNAAALKDVIDLLERLVDFYPAHIEKEDKHFFYPILDYFSKEEQDKMLLEFWEFDRKLIHEKYQKMVEGLEKQKA
jgi:hemerythrin-like domain-containing protein